MSMTNTTLPPLRLTTGQRILLALHRAIDRAEDWVANRVGAPAWQPLGTCFQYRATARWATVLHRVLPAAPNLTKLRVQQLARHMGAGQR
jgi:hypothetical protein